MREQTTDQKREELMQRIRAMSDNHLVDFYLAITDEQAGDKGAIERFTNKVKQESEALQAKHAGGAA